MSENKRLRDDPMVKLIQQHGFMTVQRAVNYVVGWAWVESRIGHGPSVAEYCEYFGVSSRSAARERKALQTVTGSYDPTAIVEAMREAGVSFKGRPSSNDALVALPFLAG